MVEWKNIDGFDGRYQISNYGAVKNVKTGRLLTIQRMENGYSVITIRKKRMLIHRLVAMAFLPNPENKAYVDHINTIRSDNRVENLRWATGSENANNRLTKEHHKDSADVYRSAAFRVKQAEAKKDLRKPVKCIETGERWESLADASRALGIDRSVLSNACRYSAKHTLWRCENYKGKAVKHYIYEQDEHLLETANKRVKNNSRRLRCIETGAIWDSVAAAAHELGLSRTYIYNACTRAANKKNSPAKLYGGKSVLHFEYVA